MLCFSDVEPNPTTKHVEEAVKFAKANTPIDIIIGLGGGSAMGLCERCEFLFTNGGIMEDYWERIRQQNRCYLLSVFRQQSAQGMKLNLMP